MEASCIIPAFENPDLLGRCLLGALAQEDVELEIVVTDDSRSSAARSIVARLAAGDGRVRYQEGPRSGNAVDNWNHGLALARGETCVLAHHDEFFIDRRYLRRAIDALNEGGLAAIIGPTGVIGVQRSSRFARAQALARALGCPLWTLFTVNWVGPTAAFVFRRGPSFDRELVQLVDVEFYRRVLGREHPRFLTGVCVGSLGHHRDSITATIDPARVAREDLRRLSARIGGRGLNRYDLHRLLRTVRARA